MTSDLISYNILKLNANNSQLLIMNLLGKKILIITAHPDDESFTAAGTIYKNVKEGGMVDVYCASKGEKGLSHCEPHITSEELSKIRVKELQNACGLLGVRNCWIKEFPDGDIESSKIEILDDINNTIADHSYDIIMSFGLDGYTGHRDHIAIAVVAQDVALSKGVTLMQFTMPDHCHSAALSHLKQRRKLGSYAPDSEVMYMPAHVSVDIDTTIKMKALACHKTQYGANDPYLCFPESIREQLKRVECFHVVEKSNI